MSDKKVYAAIAGITAQMAREGIGKDQKNQQQGYKYRGIDQVYAALSPALVEHKLCILPRVVDSSVVERQTQKGGTLIYTTLTVEFDFVSAEDGSTHTVRTVGEAMDSADKSSNKAMSAAYKYAAFMAFCIPTEGDNDADGTTYELAPERSSEPRVAPNTSSTLLQDRVEKGQPLRGDRLTPEQVAAFDTEIASAQSKELTAIWERICKVTVEGHMRDAFVSRINTRIAELKKPKVAVPPDFAGLEQGKDGYGK